MGLTACSLLTETPEDGRQLFHKFLNTDVPAAATHFEGHGQTTSLKEPWQWGYFTYQLDQRALDKLLHHRKFIEASELNRGFAGKPMSLIIGYQNVEYYSQHLKQKLVIRPKHTIGYEAVFFPYLHTIVYDTISGNAQHFVAEMRD